MIRGKAVDVFFLNRDLEMPRPAVILHWLFAGEGQIHLARKKYTKAHVLSTKPFCGCFCLFHQVLFGRSYIVPFGFFYAVGTSMSCCSAEQFCQFILL